MWGGWHTQVILVSAHEALLSRLILNGRASADEKARFIRIQFGRAGVNKSLAECRDAAEQMLQGSGLPFLEDKVRFAAALFPHCD